MLLKHFSVVLVMLVILYQTVSADNPCGPNYTVRECARILSSNAKRNPPPQSLNPLQDPDLFDRAEQMGEPTCKLRDIFTMIPDDCRTELLQILHLFVTHSDY